MVILKYIDMVSHQISTNNCQPIIVLIGNTSWSMYNFRLHLLKHLIKRGFKVYVFSPKDDYSHKFKNYGIYWCNINLSSNSKNPLRDLVLFIKLYLSLRKIKPKWVINYTIKPVLYGGLSSYLNSIKYIQVITGIGNILFKNKILTFVIKPFYKFSLLRSNHTIFLNKSDRDIYFKNKLITLNNNSIFNGEGIDLNYFNKKNFTYSKNKNSNEFILLHAGRLLWSKGLKDLVDGVKLLAGINIKIKIKVFGIVNDNDSRYIPTKLLNDWENNGLISFYEQTDNIIPEILSSDCVALQSTYGEGIPRILIEAASLEVPILASDIPGCREIVIDGKNGFLHEPGNVISISKKLSNLIMLTESERNEMGKYGRFLVNNKFCIDNICKQYDGLINE